MNSDSEDEHDHYSVESESDDEDVQLKPLDITKKSLKPPVKKVWGDDEESEDEAPVKKKSSHTTLKKNDIVQKIKMKKSTSPITEHIDISTEGVDSNKIKSINLNLVQDMIQCHCCAKYFNKNLIISDDSLGEQMCKHCVFWINYNPDTRLEFDKKCAVSGFCIAEYILTCFEAHNTTKCTRMIDTGGCLLCDYILGLDVPNILNPEMLPRFAHNVTSKDKSKKIERPSIIVDNDIVIKSGGLKLDKLVI
jgi:hypothetical protein